jgi:hypothetical protein
METNGVAGSAARSPWLMLALVVGSTVLGLMGTDLVLPAVPRLPETLGGTLAESQLVIAAYVGGTCIGLLAYGALGDRFSTRALFIGSLAATALASLACTLARDLHTLTLLRALQGAAAAGPAVFAPGIVRASFDEHGAVRAIGLLGSIEALAPALAPIVGIWLVALGGWRLNFTVLGVLAAVLALLIGLSGALPQVAQRPRGSYLRLLRDAVFLRYALSQALVLGGLLVFVFGMPTVFVHALGIGMQRGRSSRRSPWRRADDSLRLAGGDAGQRRAARLRHRRWPFGPGHRCAVHPDECGPWPARSAGLLPRRGRGARRRCARRRAGHPPDPRHHGRRDGRRGAAAAARARAGGGDRLRAGVAGAAVPRAAAGTAASALITRTISGQGMGSSSAKRKLPFSLR